MDDRKLCTYPMSQFYIYEDKVPKDIRVSKPEDCEDCDGIEDGSCEDSKHCLITIIPLPHFNPDE